MQSLFQLNQQFISFLPGFFKLRFSQNQTSSLYKKEQKYKVINLIDLEFLLHEGRLNSGEIITKQRLVEVGLLKNSNMLVKLLSTNSNEFRSDKNKQAMSALSFQLDAYSSPARKLIEEAGGKIL